jgi:hypothetical protein
LSSQLLGPIIAFIFQPKGSDRIDDSYRCGHEGNRRRDGFKPCRELLNRAISQMDRESTRAEHRDEGNDTHTDGLGRIADLYSHAAIVLRTRRARSTTRR